MSERKRWRTTVVMDREYIAGDLEDALNLLETEGEDIYEILWESNYQRAVIVSFSWQDPAEHAARIAAREAARPVVQTPQVAFAEPLPDPFEDPEAPDALPKNDAAAEDNR